MVDDEDARWMWPETGAQRGDGAAAKLGSGCAEQAVVLTQRVLKELSS